MTAPRSYEDTLIDLVILGEVFYTSTNQSLSAMGNLIRSIIDRGHPEITIKAHERVFED